MVSTIIWTLLFFGLVGLFSWQCYQRLSVLLKARPSSRI